MVVISGLRMMAARTRQRWSVIVGISGYRNEIHDQRGWVNLVSLCSLVSYPTLPRMTVCSCDQLGRVVERHKSLEQAPCEGRETKNLEVLISTDIGTRRN